MSTLRVYSTPTSFKVAKPGANAWSGDPNDLVFSSEFYGNGGGTKGSLYVPPSPIGEANLRQPTHHALALPPGTGIPAYFVWPQQVGSGAENSSYPWWTAYVVPDGSYLHLQVTSDIGLVFYYMAYRRIVG